MNTPSPRFTKTLVAAAASVAVLAAPAAAGAAPDWTPPRTIGGHANSAFAFAGGEQTEIHTELLNESPFTTRLLVTASRPGEPERTQLEIPTTPAGFPLDAQIAVAPSGQAVLVWEELEKPTRGGLTRFHVRYRSAAGEWEPDNVAMSDGVEQSAEAPELVAAIGADGTAAVAVNHHEKDDAGEKFHDQRADIVVHPAGGEWEAPFRLSTPNRSSRNPEVGIDRAGNITTTWGEVYSETTFNATAMMRRRSASNKVWTTAEDITQAAPNGASGAPRLAVAPSGRAVIVGQRDNKAFATVRESAGAAFGPLTPIGPTGATSGAAAAGIAPDGTAYAAYKVLAGGEGPHVGIARAAPGGGFSEPRRVSPIGIESLDAELGFAGDDAVLAWTGRLPSGARVVEGTRWPAGAAQPDAFRELDDIVDEGLTQVVSDGEGSALVVWQLGTDTHIAAFDGGGPSARSAEVPQGAAAGQTATMRASFADRWSPLAGEPSWDFGDGSTAAGGEVAHAWSAPGDYTVTLRSADTFGNATERRFAVHVDGPAAGGTGPAAPSAPAAPAAPTVTLKAPRCAKKLSKAACKRFLLKPAAWKKVTGTAKNAARVTVTVKRKGVKTRAFKAGVKNGKWSAKLKGLRAGGTTTISAQAIAADGAKSKPAARKLRLRR